MPALERGHYGKNSGSFDGSVRRAHDRQLLPSESIRLQLPAFLAVGEVDVEISFRGDRG